MTNTTPKANKPRKLTTKQAKFVKAKAEGKTGVEAAKLAYGLTDYNTAAVIASQNLNKLNIQEAVEAEFAKQGITLERIIRPINLALDATKVVITGKDENAFAEVEPDYAIQLKASNMAAQFMGFGRGDQSGNVNVNFINVSKGDQGEYGL